MRRWIGITALVAMTGLLIAEATRCVLINVSHSLPRGVYLRKYAEVSVGDIVVVCAESIESSRWITDRAYTGSGSCNDGTAPLLKTVAAIGPSKVVVTDSGVRINEKVISRSAPLWRDSMGRNMPVLRGEIRLANDELYLLSTYHNLSLDSRYFGPVRRIAVRMIVTPLLTEEVLWNL